MNAGAAEPAQRDGKIFVGRRRDRSQLDAAVASACEGTGSFFVVTGEPGIGKTRLAEEVVAGVRGRAEVLWGWCREEPGAPAYWPWLQILEPCAAVGGDVPAQLSEHGFAALAPCCRRSHRNARRRSCAPAANRTTSAAICSMA